ncbi:hypothetical protein ISP15_08635 [Dyella jejuensis]|uniref:Uncharacterized protein n=1 Tax=Dyella jejuensis TaxID=1432009 RepID=A0ABW8JJD7_9GAMM
MEKMKSLKEFFGWTIWMALFLPMILLSYLIPDLLFDSGSKFNTLTSLIVMTALYLILINLCVKDGKLLAVRAFNFIGIEIVTIIVLLHWLS